jgi:hypothetical protein
MQYKISGHPSFRGSSSVSSDCLGYIRPFQLLQPVPARILNTINMVQSDITLYFLNGSRAIRIAWLLEELGLPYKLVASSRGPNAEAPPDFKAKIPTKLGNSPTIQDGDLVIQESGAIVE